MQVTLASTSSAPLICEIFKLNTSFCTILQYDGELMKSQTSLKTGNLAGLVTCCLRQFEPEDWSVTLLSLSDVSCNLGASLISFIVLHCTSYGCFHTALLSKDEPLDLSSYTLLIKEALCKKLNHACETRTL